MAEDFTGQDGSRGIAYRWTFANTEFDEAAWELRVAGEAVEIERRPLDVLACLLRHAGEVVTKDELLEAAWPGRVVVEGALTNAIGKLRKALGDDAQQVIVTIPRVGYRLIAKVERRIVDRRALATHLRAGDAIPRRPHWRLTRRLDDGDRGEVWLAEHVKTHEARVFKFSFDGSRLHSLKREVTIARLLHDSLGERPDFVTIIDWDFDDAPFFIESEFGGPNLEEWAQARGGIASIPLEARLRWLAEAADALAAAHDVGVLHKDLKPANLLVRVEADDFHPRLVDFGSGKLLEPERLEALGITRLGITQTQNLHTDSLTGTPLYLAPELLAGQVPTVRSDIYALGVLLFQLCVADLRRPLSAGWENEIDDPLLREDIAAAANGNPELRMDSAREFAQHLRLRDERRLCRETEAAALAKLAERERALARVRARRPWVIAAFIALVLGVAATGIMFKRASLARARSDHDANLVKAMNGFLTKDILSAADVDVAGKANVTVMDAIKKAAENIDKTFAADKEVAANLHDVIGDVYSSREDVENSTKEFKKAADEYAEVLGPADARTLTARMKWIARRLVDDRVQGDQLREIERQLKEVQGLAEQNAAALGTSFLYKSDSLWQIYYADRNRNYAAALPYAKASYSRLQHDAEISAKSRAYAISNYADALRRTQHFDEADRVLTKAIGDYTKSSGATSPFTMDFRHEKVMVLIAQKRYVEAEPLAHALFEDRLKVLGERNTDTIDALADWAASCFGQRKWQQASDLYVRVLAMYKPLAAGWEAPLVTTKLNLSASLAKLGRGAEAMSTIEPTLAPTMEHYGTNSPFTQYLRFQIAYIALLSGELARADPLMDDKLMDAAGKYAKAARQNDWQATVDQARGLLAYRKMDKGNAIAYLQNAVAEYARSDPADYWKRQDAESLLRKVKAM